VGVCLRPDRQIGGAPFSAFLNDPQGRGPGAGKRLLAGSQLLAGLTPPPGEGVGVGSALRNAPAPLHGVVGVREGHQLRVRRIGGTARHSKRCPKRVKCAGSWDAICLMGRSFLLRGSCSIKHYFRIRAFWEAACFAISLQISEHITNPEILFYQPAYRKN